MAGGTPSDDNKPAKPTRDFLTHLETYLAKRDGVDKLLKISRYASKIALSSPSLLPDPHPLRPRLKSFESSVGLSRKAFRLGKFVQDVNALRAAPLSPLPALAYGGEGLYFFTEQFVWLAKAGLIDPKHSRRLQKISAWAEFVGYVGSVWLKIRDLRRLEEEISSARGGDSDGERGVRLKIVMKRMSIVQDLADWLMTLSDVWDEEGRFLTPIVLSCAGMVSALISTHKNWVSC